MSKVRELAISDKDSWLFLWQGYIKFYEANISQAQTENTWTRLLDTQYNSYGLVAEFNEKVCGIVHYSFQTSTWAPQSYCYLEDLFVDPDMRGHGLGRLLIDGVREIAEKAGSTRLYWNTDSTNQRARKLYDSYTQESGKVQYRIEISSPNIHLS